ncbi:MAG: MBL fold metallo-hydrolase [Pyrinomonadaceae bacterium]|nr:MBL fold metallo-hydrolase [Pyrinomonadaceae bacterium]MCX7640199.1 MBL fold metallo-hydrolase [Pyrinomonadaceae bacterium]MDW8303213.1 MBL fold metallo-hydrolase [Acidobacteriota bacterium]
MIIKTFVTTIFQQNTRVVACPKTGKTICIDPGGSSKTIADFIKKNQLSLQAIALTHGHLDHIGGVAELHSLYPEADIIIHKEDEPLYYALPEQPLALGIPRMAFSSLGLEFEKPPSITRNWEDEETYQVGMLSFKVRHCPGHTPGHVVLCEEKERKIFVGDCLFAGSVGRTDLPGGSYQKLMNSIFNKILPFGDDVVVYSGHGPETTIGHERLTNPFLR